jgi:hypothetical protein
MFCANKLILRRKNIQMNLRFLFALVGLSISILGYAQSLTISSTGQTGTSGTNWGISGNTLTVSTAGSADLNPSVITNHLTYTGDLTIVMPQNGAIQRNLNLNTSINYTGSTPRTLTFQIGNDITAVSGISVTSTTAPLNLVFRTATYSNPDNGFVKLDGVTINTNGGHLWIGGGVNNATWNGLIVGNSYATTWADDVSAISMIGSTISTNGGSISLKGMSWDSSDSDGTANYGINIENANISSAAGGIYIEGMLHGRYTTGNAVRIASVTSSNLISTTSGSLSILGTGYDQTTNGNGWRQSVSIYSNSTSANNTISSVSGNINIEGAASFDAIVNDKEGLALGGNGLRIISQTGNITLKGSNSLETSGQYCNSIRFTASDASDAIRIGFNGTNAYSGNISIEGNSIYQRNNNAGSGSIAVQTTGTLTIQPTGTIFTYLRAGDASSLTFDNDWNFGTTLGGFVYGKTTNTTALTYSNALTTGGPITMYTGTHVQNGAVSSSGAITFNCTSFSFGANVTVSTNNPLSILSKTYILNTTATTITTQGGHVLMAANIDDATDGDVTTNGYIQFSSGLTMNTNGGNITLGGGDVTASGYALGTSASPYEGLRVDGTINLNSSGGNIILRGKSYGISTAAGSWGMGFWNLSTGSITSGTGTITLDGFSQSYGGTHNAGIYTYGALTVSSANTTADAIKLIGKGIGNGSEAWAIEAESALSLIATGDGGGITMSSSQLNSASNLDVVLRGETNILAKSGPINLLGGQSSGMANGSMWIGSNMYIGSRALSAVPTSSSNITIQYDTYNFSGYNPKLATSGTLNWKPASTSFGQNVQTDWFSWSQNSQTLSGLTIGTSQNAANVYLNNAITVAGPISVYGGYVEVSNTLTSSGNSDIFLKGISNTNSSVAFIGGGITKSSGTGTLTMQGHGRVQNTGTIAASGTGVLNVIFWSDYDGDNVGGGSTLGGSSISTNGGHIWMGGSNSNGGSYTWNGLAVGDGPSTGATGANCHAIDLFAPITTGGGDVLLWASNNGGCGTAGIQSDGTRHINAGSGDITLIAYQTAGAIELTSTGVISVLPHAGAYASALTLGGTLSSGNFTFNTSFYNGLKINSLANSGLVVGNYSGHLTGGTAVIQGNTSNVTVSSALSTKSLEIYGGAIALNENITTTGTGADVLIKAISNINLAASKTITTVAGDVNLWADSDDNATGYVQLLAGAAINSTGGDINLGGGANLTSDYAFGTTTETCPEVLPNTQYISGIHLRQSSSLNSGGGNISLRGQNANTANAAMSFGVSFREVSIHSGTGKIAINGVASGSGSVNGQGVSSWGLLTLRSANTGSDAISIFGDASGVNNSSTSASLGINCVALFEATGIGGGIIINGKGGVSQTVVGTNLAGDILSASGTIKVIGASTNNVLPINLGTTTFGKKAATNVTTSSSDVILEANAITTAGTTIDCSGTLTVRSTSTSFPSSFTWPMTNVTLAAGLSGLTIGKSTNTSTITIGTATSINGPITLYGGTLALNAALTTTNTSTGNLSLNGTILTGSAGLTVANGRTLTMNLSSNTNYTGSISGSSLNFVKDGAGTLTLPTPTSLSFAAMTISAGGYKLNPTQQLTLSGALTNNGTFTMKNGASFVQATSGTSISGTGTFNVEKALSDNSSTWSTTSGRFWYMGVPMANVARSSYGTPGTTTNRLWSYTESTKSYTELTSGSLSAGTGYVHRRSTNDTLTFSATGVNGLYGSDYSVSGLTKTAGYTSGVHLVSNPYMGYLDWNAVYNASPTIDPTFYIRSNNTTSNNISALISYNGSTQQYTNTSSVAISNASQIRYIAPMQSVWVKVAAAASTGTLNMTRSMVSHQTGTGLKSSTVFPTLARVNLVDGNNFDQLLVYLNSDMTNEVDQYDSEKMPVSGTVQVYTMSSNKKLVMNGLNNNKKKVSVPLYLELPETKSYTLQLSEYKVEDGLILLEDKQEGTIQDFTLMENYTFYANSGLLQNRFVLHFILQDATITAQGANNDWLAPQTSYTEGGNVQISSDSKGSVQVLVDQPEDQKVEGTVFVTDMNGKEVYRGQLDGNVTEFKLNVPSGIYYLTVQSGTLIEKKKVFIQE